MSFLAGVCKETPVYIVMTSNRSLISFNICISIKKTVSGINLKPYAKIHIDKSFLMRLFLVAVTVFLSS